MAEYGRGFIGYILTIISLVHSSITLIVCSIVVIGVAYHFYHYRRRIKRTEKVTLILSANIYLFILIMMAALIVKNTQTLIGDMYGVDFGINRSLCIFKGYFTISISCAMCWSFIVQVSSWRRSQYQSDFENYQLFCLYFFQTSVYS